MPRSKSVLKRQRQNERRRQHNQAIRTSLKTFRKKAHQSVASGTDGQPAVRMLQVKVDKAVSKGLLHRNKAARIKSRAARALNKSAAS